VCAGERPKAQLKGPSSRGSCDAQRSPPALRFFPPPDNVRPCGPRGRAVPGPQTHRAAGEGHPVGPSAVRCRFPLGLVFVGTQGYLRAPGDEGSVRAQRHRGQLHLLQQKMTSGGRGGGGKGWPTPPGSEPERCWGVLSIQPRSCGHPAARTWRSPVWVSLSISRLRRDPGPAQHPVPPSPAAWLHPAPTKRPPAPTRRACRPTSRSRGRRWARPRSRPRPSPDPAAAPSRPCRRKQRCTGSWGVLETPPGSRRLGRTRRRAAGT